MANIFNNLPNNLIMKIIKMETDRKNKEKQDLIDFWEEWYEYYEDDLQDLFDDGNISSWDWEDLTLQEKLNIYASHNRSMRRHYSIMCDGSALDEDYESGLY